MSFVQWPLAKRFPAGRHGVVAAKHPLAAGAGVEILRRGGSAVDAAVATSLVSGVAEPAMSGLGGGGVAIYKPKTKAARALHFGMRAPGSAAPDMYEIVAGQYDADLFGWPRTVDDGNVLGPRSVALPGQVAGLRRLHEMGGRLPWGDLVRPAIDLARDGLPVDWLLTLDVVYGQDLLRRDALARATFLPGGRVPSPDLGLGADTIRQTDLAATLEAIAEDPAAWQSGAIPASIARASEGRLSPEEIGAERPEEAGTVSISFGGAEVHLVPWATGGPTVLEWLGVVCALDPPRDEGHPDLWSAVIRAGDVALADRLTRLGDPDFVPFPREILEESYHRRAAEAIRAGEVEPVRMSPGAGSTSHLAVADEAGNVVTVTQTLLSVWGSGILTAKTGLLLNNGMMWFDPEPGRPNSIAAGKRPLANMCPVLVTRDGAPWLAYGASGGRKILPAAVQILMRVVLLGQSLADAMAAPRLEVTEGAVVADARFDRALCEEVSRRAGRPVRRREPALGASPWASPVGLMRGEDGAWTGGADPYTQACVLAV